MRWKSCWVLVLWAIVATSGLTGCSSIRRTGAPPPLPPANTSRMALTLAWNGERYEVPAPATMPPGMQDSHAYRRWWTIGNVKSLEWTDPAGCRYVAQAWCKVIDADGRTKPAIPYISRYRPDGTLEVQTTYNAPGGPAQWTIYAADGRTKAVEVVNRTRGLPGTPFIQYITFYDASGVKTRQYQANQHGVVYIEWFYKPDGQVDHWNGSEQLNGPTPPVEVSTATTRP